MSEKIRVGMIGLGNMGGAIAEHLAAGGLVDLHVHDRSADAARRMGDRGATVHGSARQLADAASVVITCLPTLAASRSAIFDAEGMVAGVAARYWIEMSTIGPDAMKSIVAELGARQWGVSGDASGGVMDAPVSGGAVAARNGTLAVMVSASAPVREALDPVLSAISSRVIDISTVPGDAQTMKLINNLLAAANMANSFEALALAVKLGLAPEKVVEVVNAGSGRNTGMDDRKTSAILSRKFEGLGKIGLLEKDIALAFQVATQSGVELADLPALSGMAQLWQQAAAQHMSGEDVSALIKVVERAMGLEVRGRGGPSAS
ncbi:MAG: NAD(P)-dependent oxidoreductase [Burkholderiaceae bacterium]|nr:NAD(P)-dependent oxidoreductase [Burkholderiaceae bacterium]